MSERADRDATVHRLTPRGAAPSGARPVDGQAERRLRRLELTITRRLDGLLHGQHLGLLPGPGSELAGSREYRPGEDEVRLMDWAVTARTTVPHVREVDADRELTTWLLVDATPSMDFGTAELEKRELAVAATAAVGFLTAGAGNRLGAHVLRRRTGCAASRPAPAGCTCSACCARCWPCRAAPEAGEPGLARAAIEGAAPRPPPGAASSWWSPTSWTACRRRRIDADPTGSGALRRLGRAGTRCSPSRSPIRASWSCRTSALLTLVDPETGDRREVSTGDRRLRERYAAAAAAAARDTCGRRCAAPARRTCRCAPTGTGSPTSCGT